MGYTGLHLSVVPLIHLSVCILLFCSCHKDIYMTSATAGVKSDFLTVLVLIRFFNRKKNRMMRVSGWVAKREHLVSRA